MIGFLKRHISHYSLFSRQELSSIVTLMQIRDKINLYLSHKIKYVAQIAKEAINEELNKIIQILGQFRHATSSEEIQAANQLSIEHSRMINLSF